MPPVSGVVMAELLGIAAKPHSPAVDTMLGEVIDRVESLKRGIAKFWSENDGPAMGVRGTESLQTSPGGRWIRNFTPSRRASDRIWWT
jgi:hypothetical protein